MISNDYERRLFENPVSKRYSYFSERDEKGVRKQDILIEKEHEYAKNVKAAVCVTYEVARSREIVFKLENRRSTFMLIRAGKHGESLIHALLIPFEDIEATLPQHHFNPLFDLLRRCRDKHIHDVMLLSQWKKLVNDDAKMLYDMLQVLVDDLREGFKTPGVKRALDTARRRSDKRWKSVKRAIAESLQDCSKLLAIRVDLHFRTTSSLYPFAPSVSEAQAYGYLVKFERFLRDRHPLVRYMWCLEYGTQTGFHYHVLVLLNGHVVRGDIAIAMAMGEHWENVITEGKGRYYNCNADEYDRPGLGTIDYRNLVKVGYLVNDVAWYLTKTDFWMRYDASGKSFSINQRYRQPSPGGAKRMLQVGVKKAAAEAAEGMVGTDAGVFGCSLASPYYRALPLPGP